jgi:hypothetical protein
VNAVRFQADRLGFSDSRQPTHKGISALLFPAAGARFVVSCLKKSFFGQPVWGVPDEDGAVEPADAMIRISLAAQSAAPAFDGDLRVVLLRNPVNRVMELFMRLQKPLDRRIEVVFGAHESADLLETIRGMTLHEFATSDDPRIVAMVRDVQSRAMAAWMGAEYGSFDNPEQSIPELLETGPDFVGVYEHMPLSLHLLHLQLGSKLPEGFSLPPRDRFWTDIPASKKVRADIEACNPVDMALWNKATALFMDRFDTFYKQMIEDEYIRIREEEIRAS